MKTIKIKFVGFYDGFEAERFLLYRILKKHYDVQIVDDPDYIICSVFGTFYDYCNYPQVRIMYSGENYTPDFNFIDYAVSPYPIVFQDRNFYRPGCIDPYDHCLALQHRNRNYPESILSEKTYFANFIASHESEHGIRGDFFKELCKYRRVESPGSYLNNMENGMSVAWTNDSKTNFQRKCKFTLCFESTVHEGFITEKITDAFFSDTIPVYYGSSNVTDIFNANAFINCRDYPDFDAVIDKIKELDQDDQKYLEMLRQPIFVDNNYPEKVLTELERYLVSIFEQPIDSAYRRSRVYAPKKHEEVLTNLCCPKSKRIARRICSVVNRVLKK